MLKELKNNYTKDDMSGLMKGFFFLLWVIAAVTSTIMLWAVN